MQLQCNGQTDRPMDGPMDGLMDQQSGVETKELHSILEYPRFKKFQKTILISQWP